MSLFRRFRACRSGASAVEFAIISLVMILVSISVIEFGRGLYLRNKVAHAADIAGRKVLMGGTVSDSEIEDTIRAAFSGTSPELLVIDSGLETVNGVNFRTISVGYPLDLLIPALRTESITLRLSRRIPLV